MSYAIAVCHTPGCPWPARDSYEKIREVKTAGIAHSKQETHLVHVVIERTYVYRAGEELEA